LGASPQPSHRGWSSLVPLIWSSLTCTRWSFRFLPRQYFLSSSFHPHSISFWRRKFSSSAFLPLVSSFYSMRLFLAAMSLLLLDEVTVGTDLLHNLLWDFNNYN
jgi:hypothetical protein